MSQQQSSSTPKPTLKAITPGHLLVSVLITALVTAGNAVLQYSQSNGGTFSFTELLGIAFTSLLATLGTGVITLEKSPTVQQAIDGSLAPYVNALNQTLQQHGSLVNQAGQLVSFLLELAQKQASVQVQPTKQVQAVQQQQAPAPQPQLVQMQAPQQIPAVNLATNPFAGTSLPTANTYVPQQSFPAQPALTRNFDTGLTPAINQ